MRTAIACVLLTVTALGCKEAAEGEPVVHVVLVLEDPGVLARAAEIDDVTVVIETRGGQEPERIERTVPAPDGAFSDGRSDFDFAYGDRTGEFDLVVAVGVSGEALALGEVYELPIEAGEVELTLLPWTNQWSSPEAIDAEDGVDAEEPRVALDGRGEITVVWAAGNELGGNGGGFGDGWDGPVVVASGTGEATHPRLALDDAGTAFLVWQQPDADESVFALRRGVDAAWPATPLEIDYDIERPAFRPEIAVNAGGTAVATFLQTWNEDDGTGETDTVWAGFYLDPTFAAGEPMDYPSTEPIVESAVTVDADDRAFVVWNDEAGRIRWNHYASGEDPENDRPLGNDPLDTAADASLPRIVADSFGAVFVAWTSGGRIYVSREDALTWVDTELSDAGTGTVQDLRIVPDAGGVALAFVRGGRAWGASWDDGWSAIVPLHPSEELEVEPDIALASDGAGALVAAFVTGFEGMRTLWVARQDGATWLPPAAIANAEELSAPDVAIDAAADAIVVWQQRAAGRTRIFASLRGL